jgi:hypothetical protein
MSDPNASDWRVVDVYLTTKGLRLTLQRGEQKYDGYFSVFGTYQKELGLPRNE